MILASFVFFALLVFGVPVAFVMLGASVFYFVENPMMASIVAQRMSILNKADRLLLLRDGGVAQYGDKAEVLAALGPSRRKLVPAAEARMS